MTAEAARKREDGTRTTLTAFARSLGVSIPAVEQAIKTGRVTAAEQTPKGWKITDAEAARRQWAENTRPKSDGPGGKANGQRPAPATLAAATLRERLARARLIELDYKRKRRALVPEREVELRWSRHVVGARTAMLGVPSRAKQRLPHLSVSDLAVLDALIRESLEQLAGDEPEGGEA